MKTTKPHLKTLALALSFMGFIALFVKSFKLLNEAYSLDNTLSYLILTILLGLFFGSIKAKYIFIKSCHKNFRRIDGLIKPRLWDFYSLGFFIFLATVIILGASLSSWAEGSYMALSSIAVVDISVGFALFISGIHCIKNRP